MLSKLKGRHRLIVVLLLTILVISVAAYTIVHSRHLTIGHTHGTTPDNIARNKASSPSFNKQQYSIDQVNSLWLVVNKRRVLNPITYTPTGLVVPNIQLRLGSGSPEMHVRTDTANALESMFVAAKQQGVQLMLASGYRSYTDQGSLYDGYVSKLGQVSADNQSARPGHSEHQTGLAADIEPASRRCEIDQCFANLPEGKWLAANAYMYGFIIRYPNGKQAITGYEYEPWHVRYVGVLLATELHKTNTATLEEFFGLPAAPTY